MKYIKISIIIVIIICVILAIAILLVNNIGDLKVEEDLKQNIIDEYTIVPDTSILILENEDIFFTIEQIAQNYIKCATDKNANGLYNMMDKKYIIDNQITENNVLEKNEFIYDDTDLVFSLEKVYTTDITTDIIECFAYGSLYNIEKTESQDFYLTVLMDFENNTFSILPIQCKYISNYEDEEISQIQKYITENAIDNTPITVNPNNHFDIVTADDYKLANKYFLNCKYDMLCNVEKSYDHLDEEYKTKRFASQKEYEDVIESKAKEIATANVSQYTVSNEDGYIEYICMDTNGYYYIFHETSIGNYTVILDTYTIANDNLKEQYTNLSEVDKGVANIRKFFEMISMQDYELAYGLLDENFKQNYFPTVQEFAQYIQNRLFRYNKITSGNYNTELAKIYAYKLGLQDATGQNSEQKEFVVIMKLLEGTDFVMSFEMN